MAWQKLHSFPGSSLYCRGLEEIVSVLEAQVDRAESVTLGLAGGRLDPRILPESCLEAPLLCGPGSGPTTPTARPEDSQVRFP